VCLLQVVYILTTSPAIQRRSFLARSNPSQSGTRPPRLVETINAEEDSQAEEDHQAELDCEVMMLSW